MSCKWLFLLALQTLLSTATGQAIEAVPLQFIVEGLPDVFQITTFNEEMTKVLGRILNPLGRKIGMTLTSIEREIGGRRLKGRHGRALAREVAFEYNVNVLRDEGKDWGALIIEELRETYEDVLAEVRSYTDTAYINGGDIELNWCAKQDDGFTLCVREIIDDGPTDSNPFPELEVIPMKIDITGLPDDVRVELLEQEMLSVLQQAMDRVGETTPGLTIVRVETNDPEQEPLRRALLRDETLYFNINVLKSEDGESWRPLIYNKLQEAFDDVLGEIFSLGGTRYINKGVGLSWCIFGDGEFDLCVRQQAAPTDTTTTTGATPRPTGQPVSIPVSVPAVAEPSALISRSPTLRPASAAPSVILSPTQPTEEVPSTSAPSANPTDPPSLQRFITDNPTTLQPSSSPVTASPSKQPTTDPATAAPTNRPVIEMQLSASPSGGNDPVDEIGLRDAPSSGANGSFGRALSLGLAAALSYAALCHW
ncbi:hypothetical protein ACHAXT_004230 [Thalassiosira profunda]